MTATESPPVPRTFHIAVLPGDGIGVDVTREAVRVLPARETGHGGMKFAFHESSETSMNRAGVKPMETDTANSKLHNLWEIVNLPSKP